MTNLLDQGNDLTLDENKNYLEELVGEGRKFKTPEDLAKSKVHADIHIATLESRMDAMREDMLKMREENVAGPKLQELIDRLSAQQQLTSREQPLSNEDRTASFDPKQMESLISSKLSEYEMTKKQAENYSLVKDKLTERYGNSYASVLKEKSRELGLSDPEVESMARINPNLFFKTFDVNEQGNRETFQTPPHNQRRTDNFAPKNDKRGWSYYEDLRKKDPMIYFSPKIANEMDKQAQLMGWEAFRNS